MNVGRYALGERIAAGGMATVHLGRLVGSAGFARTVAIKRLHPHLTVDPTFAESFADEARMVARIRHPNVVPTLDVVRADGELLIVMEYVDGEALSALVRRAQAERIPQAIVVAIVSEMLHGLHAAHEAKGEDGAPLEIVHRDVSPQNVLVGADGVARLVDFGIARTGGANKARQNATGDNDLKGKLAYMAPEQIRRDGVTRRTDIFAAGIVLWELLTGQRLFASDNEGAVIEKILVGWVQPPSVVAPGVPSVLDDITLRALDADPNNRFATAREMAVALEDALNRALGREVGAWVEKIAAETLAQKRALIARAEKLTTEGSETADDLRAQRPHFEPVATELTAELPTTQRPQFQPLEERTGTAFAESMSPSAVLARRSQDRYLYGALAIAVALVILVGAAWSRIRPAPAPAFSEVAPPPPAVVVVATPEPSASVAPPPAPPVVAKKPPPRPVRAKCISKLDPATGKKIYQGDCD